MRFEKKKTQGTHFAVMQLYLCKYKGSKGGGNSNLTGVLHASSNSLHGENQGVFQTRGIFTCWVQSHKFISWFAFLFRNVLHIIVWITDTFQCISLENIHGGDVRITQPESLLQVRVSFKNFLVPSHLPEQQETKISLGNN